MVSTPKVTSSLQISVLQPQPVVSDKPIIPSESDADKTIPKVSVS